MFMVSFVCIWGVCAWCVCDDDDDVEVLTKRCLPEYMPTGFMHKYGQTLYFGEDTGVSSMYIYIFM
jgi:hypothetical protein